MAHITHFQFTEFSAIIILQRRAGETVEVTAKKDWARREQDPDSLISELNAEFILFCIRQHGP